MRMVLFLLGKMALYLILQPPSECPDNPGQWRLSRNAKTSLAKLEFANALRGLVALSVVASYYNRLFFGSVALIGTIANMPSPARVASFATIGAGTDAPARRSPHPAAFRAGLSGVRIRLPNVRGGRCATRSRSRGRRP
jgi:hypothetical protein